MIRNPDLQSIAQKLKTYCACGGTHKNGQIMLQGDHRDRVKEFLIKSGIRRKTSNSSKRQSPNQP